jgi:hypothetical protein
VVMATPEPSPTLSVEEQVKATVEALALTPAGTPEGPVADAAATAGQAQVQSTNCEGTDGLYCGVLKTEIWRNGQIEEIDFPQTAEAFLALVALPCPESETRNCIELTPEMVSPERTSERGVIYAWRFTYQADLMGNYPITYVRNVFPFMQNGFGSWPAREACGITTAEMSQMGWERAEMAGIPGLTQSIAVEGFTFFHEGQLGVGTIPQTAAERCPGTLEELDPTSR